ncbi:MAG: zinc ribbon domain-containing protein [Tissierellia bacterium]|nr:zinc ribbon domain-containing protein [Tissierellia bacterium]
MDLFNQLGKSMEKFGARAKDISVRGMEDMKTASQNAKLKLELRELEDHLMELYQELGRSYYLEQRNQKSKVEVPSEELLLEIDEENRKREALEHQILYRALDGKEADSCPVCGKKVAPDALFCAYCGSKLNDHVEVIEMEKPKFKLCSHCHYEAEIESTFCPRCGTEFSR